MVPSSVSALTFGSLLGLVLVGLGSCSGGKADAGRSPGILLSGATLRLYPAEGAPKVATAETVTFERKTGVVAAEGIVVDLPPSEAGLGGSRLEAERGQGDIHGKGAMVEGPIHATSGRGDRAATVGTVWDGEEDLLAGDERVKALGPGYSLEGGSYRYQASDRRLALVDGVRFRSEKTGGEKDLPPVDVQSPVLTVDHPKRQATFSGGVILTQGDLVVRCPELVAHYDQEPRIRKVVCKGRVHATEGAKVMEAAGGTFDNEARRLVLEGEPTISEGERWIRGESMVWEADARIARVEKGEARLPAGDLPSMPGEGGALRVVAETIAYEEGSRTISFSRKVVATRGATILHASRLVAVTGEDGKLERAWTEGGPVSVVEGPRRATAGKASLEGGGSRLVLSGSPRLWEESSSLEGSRVVFHIGRDRVEVEQPRAVFPLEGKGKGGWR